MSEVQLVSKSSSDELLNKYPDMSEAEDLFLASPSCFHLASWQCECPRAAIWPKIRNRRRSHAFVYPETGTLHSLWIEEEQITCKKPLNPVTNAGRALQTRSSRKQRRRRWVWSNRCASVCKKIIHSHSTNVSWERISQEDDQGDWSIASGRLLIAEQGG